MEISKFIRSKQATLIGIISLIINLAFFILAMMVSPEYDILTKTLSKLGTMWPGTIFFSSGLLIGAIGSFILLIQVTRNMNEVVDESQKRNVQRNYYISLLMIICMIGVVIFPSAGITSDIHDIIAITLFICMGIITTWLSRIMETYERWDNRISYLGYSCTISVIILGLLLDTWEYGPFIQKIPVLIYFFWLPLINNEVKEIISI